MSQPVPNQQPGAPYQQAGAEDPGKTLGIVGLILSFFTAVIGLIISAVALNRSKKAGFTNTPALVGIIIGALGTIGVIIAIIASVALFSAGMNNLAEVCRERGPGTHEVNGVTYTCPG